MIVGDTGLKRLLLVALFLLGFAGAALLDQQGRVTSTPAPMFSTPTPAAALTFIAPTFAPTAAVTRVLAPYPVYGPAAELHDQVWLNTPTPLRLANLRGQVVLLEFWAFDCVPCLPVLANVHTWYATYGTHGLAVIGIHYPKVAEERNYDQLAAALTRLDVRYPVAQDNDGLIWQAYGQTVWPTLTLIDKHGYLRYQQIGAGGYDAMETAIRALLAEQG